MTLGIDLQDGFSDDTVVVEINGKEVLRIEHVQTSGPTGFAHAFTARVETGMVSVIVRLITRNLERVLNFHVSKNRYLGFSVVDGFIDHIFSDVPYGYA